MLANVCQAFSGIMQFMSTFFTLFVAINTTASKLKILVCKQKSNRFFHYMLHHRAFIVLFLLSKQISAFSLCVRELLSLFGMHLKYLWINVLLVLGWWKFHLRIHAWLKWKHQHHLMVLMPNLFQTVQQNHIVRCMHGVCMCVTLAHQNPAVNLAH